MSDAVDPDSSSQPTAATNGGRAPGLLAQMTRALRSRNYRLFFGGQLISLIGTFLTQMATAWLVYRLTAASGNLRRASFMLGVVGFVGQIPMFFITPFAGVWVDRVDRRKLIIITQILAMCQSLAMAVLAFTHIGIPAIIALAFVQGVINAFDLPARQAFMVEMVDNREDLSNAIALNSTMVHGARLIGPALAGVIILWVGEAWCFLLDGLSYIAVIAALLAMHVAARPARLRETRVLDDLADGLHYVWGHVPIRTLLLTMAVVSLAGMPALSVLMPVFGDYFAGTGHGAMTFGLLMGASGIGALIGALYLASRKSVVGLVRLIGIACSLLGLGMIGLAISRTFWVSFCVLPLAGFGMITTFASCNTLLQTLAEDQKRGRVMSLFTTAFIGMAPFGALIAGSAAWGLGPGIVGASRAMLIAGAVCIGTSAVFLTLLPGLRRLIRPIYVQKGIIIEVAGGMQAAAELTAAQEG